MAEEFEYKKFRENIRTIIIEETNKILQSKNLYETHSGTVLEIMNDTTNPYEQICSVDLVYTQVKSLWNKSGQLLKIGDSVIVFEKVGSHASNCFIAFKNA